MTNDDDKSPEEPLPDRILGPDQPRRKGALSSRQWVWYSRIRNMLAVAMLFMAISVVAVNGVAVLSDSDRYLEVQGFSAGQTGHTADGQPIHTVHGEYEAADSYNADVALELVHVKDSGEVVVESWDYTIVLEKGVNGETLTLRAPQNLPDGEYYYRATVTFDAERYVEKETTVETAPFVIERGESV